MNQDSDRREARVRRLEEAAAKAREIRDFGREAVLSRLGQLAKQRREELGISRVTFAKAADLGSDSTMRDFEFGRRLPHGQTLRKIEKALGWRLGVVDDMLLNEDRKASSIHLEDLDEFEPGEAKPLDMIPTVDLLNEVISRLTNIKSALAAPNTAIQDVFPYRKDVRDMFGLAASTNVEHLEEEEGDEKD